jgi:hypothetical protein
MLLLVAGPVVRDVKIRTDNMLKECLESNIKVVCYDIRVVLDI